MSASSRGTVLIGFSMGGGIALSIAAQRQPDKLILLAPFWKMADRRAALLPVMQHVKPTFNAFEHASFDDPTVRDGFAFIDPTLDLDDPAMQERLRQETGIPTSALVELQRLGKTAWDAAPSITTETLVIQGDHDETVLPDDTRALVNHLPGSVRLFEVNGDHQLVRDNRPAWRQICDTVVQFATARGDA